MRVLGLFLSLALLAQPSREANPCRGDAAHRPVLPHRDDAIKQPEFLAFRRALQGAAARHDREAILRVLDPDVKVDFGGASGVDAFKATYLDDAGSNFWEEFATVLALGGTFVDANTFHAPYTFSTWPEAFDALECYATIARTVRVRAAPNGTAKVVAVLESAIVQPLFDEADVPGWQRVRLADDRIGYVEANTVRSPAAFRAIFTLKNGRWWVAAFLTGD